MRLFIALELPGDVRERLARSAASLETSWTSGRLLPAENYHLTLVFLGEVPEGAGASPWKNGNTFPI